MNYVFILKLFRNTNIFLTRTVGESPTYFFCISIEWRNAQYKKKIAKQKNYKAYRPKGGKKKSKTQRKLSLQTASGTLLFSLALMHTRSNSSFSLLLQSDRLQDPL